MSPEGRSVARRERKKAQTRDAIVAAAFGLFAERGFDAVTVSEIADAADVSAKTVFNHFAAKEQLFFEDEPLLRGEPGVLVESRAPGATVTEAIEGLLSNSAGHASDPRDQATWARVYAGSPALRAHARESFSGWEGDLAGVIEAEFGARPGTPSPGVVAAVVLAAVREAWESTLAAIAGGAPPDEAVAEGRGRLAAALVTLAPVMPERASGQGDAAVVPPASIQGDAAVVPQVSAVSPASGRGAAAVAPRAPRGERPSITRVAELAGVSATTVSHTLNGRRPVADSTRRRVLDAIERLGYRPNVLARGLRTSRSQTIGLVIPDITNPFYPALARGLQDVLGPAGYDEIISNTDGDRDMERAAIEQMIARQVDGLAFAVFHTHAEDLLPAIEAGIPVVRLGGRLVQEGVDVVHSDDEGGAAEAARYLLARGYRRIGFVCGPEAEGPAAERVSGYRAALAEAGAPVDPRLVVHTHFSRAGGREGAAALLDLPEPPDAVLCANDIMAIGALETAALRGLRVPDDLAVMGFDDIEAAGLISPGLTTMANPAREIGQACARLLLDRLSGQAAGYREVVIPARLVRRQSA
jgi:DNA-binding LacI/PurR family transcriptional regulator/AcrR family transcriptional regulator